MRVNEIIFDVTESLEGGYEARALGHSIFTQGEDRDDLKGMAREAVLCHFDEEEAPRVIRLHLVREEAIAVWGCPAISPVRRLRRSVGYLLRFAVRSCARRPGKPSLACPLSQGRSATGASSVSGSPLKRLS